MPFVEEENLVKLYDEIDKLSVKEEELRKSYIDLKLRNDKIESKNKTKNILIVAFLLVALLLSFFLYQFNQRTKELTIEKSTALKELDSISEIQSIIASEKEDENYQEESDLIYTVQIGAFKMLDINQEGNHSKNLKETLNESGVHIYSIGEFSDLEKAKKFKTQIREIGVKDAFVAPYYKGKKITMKEAKSLNQASDD